MTKELTVKKTPIGEIGSTTPRVTIADEIELETKYHIDPALTPEQLASCWLDPSERQEAIRTRWKIVTDSSREQASLEIIEILKLWLRPEALRDKIIRFEQDTHFGWANVKPKVLRKYNLTNLAFNSMVSQVHSLAISSRQPLYDTNAHANHVRNVLRAIKIRYPNVHFEHEGCWTSGACPVGLQDALRKLALETHGKNRDD